MITTLVALCCAAVAAILVWLWAARQQATLTERLRAAEADRARLTGELDAARSRVAQADAQLSSAQASLSAERAAATEKLRTLSEAHDRLTNEFIALSADALKSNNAAFLELAKATLAQQQTKAEGDLSARQQAIDALVKPLPDARH